MSEWISTGDRTPRAGDAVLICTREKGVEPCIYIAFHMKAKWITDFGLWIDDDHVTHWMSLPDPPEED